MSRDVFISHSSKDKAIADAVCCVLEEIGITCWIAPRNIPGGSNYGAEISKAIKACRILLLVFSANSNTSDAVAREAQKAFEEKKTIIPLKLDETEVGHGLAFYLSGIHWIRPGDAGDFNELVKAVSYALTGEVNGENQVSAATTVSPEVPVATAYNPPVYAPVPQYTPPPPVYTQPVYAPPPAPMPYMPYTPAPVYPAKKTNGVGTGGFVMAIIGFFLGWIPIVGWLIWAVGFVLSFAGVFFKPRNLAIAGLVISLFWVVFAIVVGGIGNIDTALSDIFDQYFY